MRKHIPEYNKKNIHLARLLRRRMTEAERKLWSLLRHNKLGVKFRRQVPFDKYILDFYSVKSRLNVELDGSQHYTDMGQRNDRARDSYLRERGIIVLRFSDIDMLQNPTGVLQVILDAIRENAQTQTPSSPSPKRGRDSYSEAKPQATNKKIDELP